MADSDKMKKIVVPGMSVGGVLPFDVEYFVNEEDNRMYPTTSPEEKVTVGDNGHIMIGDFDTGVSCGAGGVDPDTGVPISILINPTTKHWIINGKDTGIVAEGKDGTQGPKGDKGDKGDTGPKGEEGLPGAIGPTGPKGDKGDKGNTGLQGPKGDKGDTGATGLTGPKGDTGATGPKGDKGDKGDNGITPSIDAASKRWLIGDVDTGIVAEGAKGDKGDKGDVGEQGPKGDVGSNGLTPSINSISKRWFIGDTDTGIVAEGKDGTTGDQGPKGDKGDKGDTGDTGVQGPKGDKGDKGDSGITPSIDNTTKHWMLGETDTEIVAEGKDGAQGPKGDKGDKGDIGAVGPKGDIGATGAQGPKGDAGPTGPQGPKGDTGTPGVQGPTGPKGDKGDNGITPSIDPTSKNWMLGSTDTGVCAEGPTKKVNSIEPDNTGNINLKAANIAIDPITGLTASTLQEAVAANFQSVSNGKTLLKEGITDKGGSLPSKEASEITFSEFKEGILSIPTGESGRLSYSVFEIDPGNISDPIFDKLPPNSDYFANGLIPEPVVNVLELKSTSFIGGVQSAILLRNRKIATIYGADNGSAIFDPITRTLTTGPIYGAHDATLKYLNYISGSLTYNNDVIMLPGSTTQKVLKWRANENSTIETFDVDYCLEMDDALYCTSQTTFADGRYICGCCAPLCAFAVFDCTTNKTELATVPSGYEDSNPTAICQDIHNKNRLFAIGRDNVFIITFENYTNISNPKMEMIPYTPDTSNEPNWSGAEYLSFSPAFNGNYYAFPSNSTNIIQFEPTTNTIRKVAALEFPKLIRQMRLAPNGRFYGGCEWSDQDHLAIEFNPYTHTIRYIAPTTANSVIETAKPNYYAAVAGFDGCIYLFPHGTKVGGFSQNVPILQIDTGCYWSNPTIPYNPIFNHN